MCWTWDVYGTIYVVVPEDISGWNEGHGDQESKVRAADQQ